MTNINDYYIDSNNNSKTLKLIRNFCEDYIDTYPDTNFKYSSDSLYNSILNIYYDMGLKENQIIKFQPMFFKEYFLSKESFNK